MKRAAGLLSLLVTVCAASLSGWAGEGHALVVRAAVQRLPGEVPRFLRKAGARLVYLASEPDRWRGREEPSLGTFAPDHFLDMERLPRDFVFPPTRFEYYKDLYERRGKMSAETRDLLLPEAVGTQPYAAIEAFDRLKLSFRSYRQLKAAHRATGPVELAIVFYAGLLSHYVADAAQPLHTTVNYNGWVEANPRGYRNTPDFHGQVDGAFVQGIALGSVTRLVRAPTPLPDPFSAYVSYLRASFGRMERLYQLEQAGGFGERRPEGPQFILERLAAGSQMLVDLWLTAWRESVVPPDWKPFRGGN